MQLYLFLIQVEETIHVEIMFLNSDEAKNFNILYDAWLYFCNIIFEVKVHIYNKLFEILIVHNYNKIYYLFILFKCFVLIWIS